MSSSPAQLPPFESLYQQYRPMVLQVCLGYVQGDRDQAKDLAQEIFINVWRALPQFRGEASAKTWIYRITVNTCLMYIRTTRRKEKVAQEAVHHLVQADWVEEGAMYQPLYQAIGKLPELDRLIIMMVLDELEYEEIARVTGINAVSLRVRIHRIKNKLRQLL
ncbi:RNA polymerase sigma factor [Telluribacter sp. SYSU D00476]|uniref:RNA polymerase sigma factor n=1 Tax=Telluribacter sp. SYSU D00476 TaxID=2811430 RepID=UPI001FF4BB98|nr:sigma-70 family RNA polymerase sigma factor [Telluribacter sp. SYSU D00476]